MFVLCIGLIICVLLLAPVPAFRRWLFENLSRSARALLDRLTPAEEVDELAVELWRAVRLERLRADVRRLQRSPVSRPGR